MWRFIETRNFFKEKITRNCLNYFIKTGLNTNSTIPKIYHPNRENIVNMLAQIQAYLNYPRT